MSDILLNAIQMRDVDRVAALLFAGEDPNENGRSRYSDGVEFPLRAAIGELEASDLKPAGPIEPIVLLLRYGAVVKGWDVTRAGDPLLDAVEANSLEGTQLLLAAGADPNIRDDTGYSPLRICAEKGFVEMARLLLLCGADKTMYESGNVQFMSALGLAAYELHVEMVRLLLAHGANPQARDVDRRTPLDCLQDRLRFVGVPADPEAQERVQQIRQLLGGVERKDTK
jgi:hypothetical protein